MRRGLGTLAAAVVVGITVTATMADGPPSKSKARNPLYFSGSGEAKSPVRRAAGTAPPSRYVRQRGEDGSVPPVPGIRNYHRELFGTDGPKTSESPAPKPAEIPADGEKPTKIADETAKPISEANGPAEGAGDETGDEADVVNAAYNRSGDAEEWGTIEMVTGQVAPDPERLTISATRKPSDLVAGPKSPTLTLEWQAKGDVNVGQECELELVVANESETSAHDVAVEAFFPNTVRLLETIPAPAENQDRLSWSFPQIDAGQTERIAIRLIPARRGPLATTAQVRFTGAAAGDFTVQEPLIELAVNGPQEVHIGDPASQIVTISNPGTGIARNVVLEALVPEGLEHTKGTTLTTDVGTLNPGESRQVRLALAAIGGGLQSIQVNAKADGNLRQAIEANVDVIAPSLKIEVDGPGLRYLGRTADYLLTVVNDGTTPTDNVRVVHRVPEGFEFLKASKGGKFVEASRQLQWFVGRLEPGQKVTLASKLEPKQLGDFEHRIGAVSEHGGRSEAVAVTRIDGSASLVLEIVDLDDPVETGVETAYEVRVRNDGTKAAADVGVSCELPEGVELLDAKGAAPHEVRNGLIVFQSLESLAPGKTALYRVHVRGAIAGNQRFRARLGSESITEPLVAEELTKFYGGE